MKSSLAAIVLFSLRFIPGKNQGIIGKTQLLWERNLKIRSQNASIRSKIISIKLLHLKVVAEFLVVKLFTGRKKTKALSNLLILTSESKKLLI